MEGIADIFQAVKRLRIQKPGAVQLLVIGTMQSCHNITLQCFPFRANTDLYMSYFAAIGHFLIATTTERPSSLN